MKTFPKSTEQIQDIVAALLVEGTGVTLAYNDGAGTLTISSSVDLTGYATTAYVDDEVSANGVSLQVFASNASNLTTGQISDDRLSSNVPLKNAANTFTAAQSFGSTGQTSINTSGQLMVGGTQTTFGPAGSGRSYINTSAGLALGSGLPIAWSSNVDAGLAAIDVSARRNATGPTFEIWAANGLKVCNAAGSAVAPVTAKAGGTRFVNSLQGTHGIEFHEIAGDGRTAIRNSANTGSSIDFWHAGSMVINAATFATGNIAAVVTWGTGASGNSNNIKLIQSSASGADATLTLKAERYVDATTNGQPKLQLLGKELIFTTGNPDSYDPFNSGWSERMRIVSAGRVLIGTASDDGTTKLQVNGGLSATYVRFGAVPKSTLLALTPNVTTDGRRSVSDSTPPNREAYPDGTNWRWASDDSIVS